MALDSILTGLTEQAAKAPALGNSLKFDFGEGQIHIDGTGDTNIVTAGDKDADCTIKISMDDFIALTKGDLNPMGAFMSGKIKVDGNMGVAMKLQGLLG